jgi:hypothetical protein
MTAWMQVVASFRRGTDLRKGHGAPYLSIIRGHGFVLVFNRVYIQVV